MQTRIGPLDPLAAAVRFLVALLFVLLIASVFAQVVFRYLLQMPLIWAEDINTFTFIWLAFLGGSLGVRYRMHFGIDTALDMLSPGGQAILRLLIDLGILVFSFYMLKEGWAFTAVSRGMRTFATGLPMVWMYAAVPAGGALCVIFALEDTLRVVREGRRSNTHKMEAR